MREEAKVRYSREFWKKCREKGKKAEDYAIDEFEKQGFVVVKTLRYDSENERKVVNDFGILDLPLPKDILNQLISDLLTLSNYGLPDLILVKDGWLSFTEIKSDKSQLTMNQKIARKKLKERGYFVDCVRIQLTNDGWWLEPPTQTELNKWL